MKFKDNLIYQLRDFKSLRHEDIEGGYKDFYDWNAGMNSILNYLYDLKDRPGFWDEIKIEFFFTNPEIKRGSWESYSLGGENKHYKFNKSISEIFDKNFIDLALEFLKDIDLSSLDHISFIFTLNSYDDIMFYSYYSKTDFIINHEEIVKIRQYYSGRDNYFLGRVDSNGYFWHDDIYNGGDRGRFLDRIREIYRYEPDTYKSFEELLTNDESQTLEKWL